MATEGPGRAPAAASLTALPRLEDIPRVGDGLDAERVREAFDAFRRHAAQMQAQLRVLQAAGQRTGPQVERYRQESERQRNEMLTAARNEVRELRANAEREVTQELREAEARAARLLEQARHQATELTNATRAEVEQTLEWARAQAGQ